MENPLLGQHLKVVELSGPGNTAKDAMILSYDPSEYEYWFMLKARLSSYFAIRDVCSDLKNRHGSHEDPVDSHLANLNKGYDWDLLASCLLLFLPEVRELRVVRLRQAPTKTLWVLEIASRLQRSSPIDLHSSIFSFPKLQKIELGLQEKAPLGLQFHMDVILPILQAPSLTEFHCRGSLEDETNDYIPPSKVKVLGLYGYELSTGVLKRIFKTANI